MANSVYHFHFLNELLPESAEDKATFARENTAKLTGGADKRSHLLHAASQPRAHLPAHHQRPGRLTQVHGALRAAGAVPAFDEPEEPYW